MKKFISRFTVTLMVVILMTGTAFAGGVDFGPVDVENNVTSVTMQQEYSSDEAKIISIAEKTNEHVMKEIEKAQTKAERAKDEEQLDKIIEKLLDKTYGIVERNIAKIERLGGEAECEYVEIEIGGKTVLVDPLRIVRL